MFVFESLETLEPPGKPRGVGRPHREVAAAATRPGAARHRVRRDAGARDRAGRRQLVQLLPGQDRGIDLRRAIRRVRGRLADEGAHRLKEPDVQPRHQRRDAARRGRRRVRVDLGRHLERAGRRLLDDVVDDAVGGEGVRPLQKLNLGCIAARGRQRGDDRDRGREEHAPACIHAVQRQRGEAVVGARDRDKVGPLSAVCPRQVDVEAEHRARRRVEGAAEPKIIRLATVARQPDRAAAQVVEGPGQDLVVDRPP